MLFNEVNRNAVLDTWRADSAPCERAKADNIYFEERVSPARLRHFEALAPDTPSPASLETWQTEYQRFSMRLSRISIEFRLVAGGESQMPHLAVLFV